MVTNCETEKNQTTPINQGKASEMLAYLVPEHDKTSQTRKIRKKKELKKTSKKPTGVLKIVMQDQKDCKNIRAEEEQITAARAKPHEDEEENTGIRPNKKKTKKKHVY